MNPLWTKKEVAAYLNCSESKIEKLMKAGSLTFVKIGTLVRFRPGDIEKLVGNFVGTPHPSAPIPVQTGGNVPTGKTITYGSRRNGTDH